MFWVTTLALELGELEVRLVGIGTKRNHLRAIKLEELRRMSLVEAVGKHGLGRIVELLVVQAINAAEIRNAARRGDARATKEDNALVALDASLELGGGLGWVRDGDGHGSLDSRARSLRHKHSPWQTAGCRSGRTPGRIRTSSLRRAKVP